MDPVTPAPKVPDFVLKRSQGYLGNTKLKRAGVKLALTPEHKAEFQKCADDIVYFCKTYMKIVSLDHGLINFDTYPFQDEILKSALENRFNLVVIGRQSGKTTVNTAVLLHYVLFNEFKNVAIIANKGSTAKEVLRRIMTAYEHLPKWLQQGVIEWNKGSCEFENHCKILSAATTSSAIRGFSINLLFIDEVAHIPTGVYEEFFRSVYPTISAGKTTKIFMVSTPNGMNHFYQLVKAAREKKSDFTLLEYDWRAVPGRDDKWKEQEIRNTSPETFAQEYENAFLGTSTTLLTGGCLAHLSYDNPLRCNEGRTIKIFEDAKPDHIYFATVDVSEGLSQDYSTMSIIDITEMPYKQVMTFRSNKISPLILPGVIHQLASAYNHAYVLVENNSIGYGVVSDLNYDLEYENILFVKVAEDGNSENPKTRLGIRTSFRTKSLGCLRLKDIIESGTLNVVDEQTILELYTFVENGKTYSAADEMHDDMVMGLVNFAYYTSTSQFQNLTQSIFKIHFKEMKMREIEDSMPPLPYINDNGGKDAYVGGEEGEAISVFDRSFYD